jgi:hypothetical protein
MSRNVYAITAEPRGRVYKKLLAESLRCCDQFLFVDVPEPRFGPNDTSFRPASRDLVRELEPHLLKVEKSKSWPGTRLGELPGVDVYARIYRFRLDSGAVDILTRVADRLYAWRWPELPSDLCLVRAEGEAWLVNIATEDESYLLIDGEEADELGKAIPELILRRKYPKH